MEYQRHYTCGACGGEFNDNADWSESQLRLEQAENGWADLPDEEMMRVCDDCYKKMMAVRN